MSSGRFDRRRSSRLPALAIVVLLVLSVPWYFPSGDGSPFVFGVPLWCVVSFGCYAAIAAVVAVFMPRLWDERGAAPRGDR